MHEISANLPKFAKICYSTVILDPSPVYLVYLYVHWQYTLGYTDGTLAYANAVHWNPSVYTGRNPVYSYTGATLVHYSVCTVYTAVYVQCIH